MYADTFLRDSLPRRGCIRSRGGLRGWLATKPSWQLLLFGRRCVVRPGTREGLLSLAPRASSVQNTATPRLGRPAATPRQRSGGELWGCVRRPSARRAWSARLCAPRRALGFRGKGSRTGAPRGSTNASGVFAGLLLAWGAVEAFSGNWSVSQWASVRHGAFSRSVSTGLDHCCSLPPASTASSRSVGYRGAVANKRLLLTAPDAAQSVLRPLCLLSGLAADCHVSGAEISHLRIPLG